VVIVTPALLGGDAQDRGPEGEWGGRSSLVSDGELAVAIDLIVEFTANNLSVKVGKPVTVLVCASYGPKQMPHGDVLSAMNVDFPEVRQNQE